MNTTTADVPAEALRAEMVDRVVQEGHARSAAVESAMRTVPRHQFVPEATLEDAYAEIAVSIKNAPDGSMLSCASVPGMVALMLDQLDVHPGQRILEIGAGTGYNAALLAELTGPTGHVTTVDLDPDVTAHARRNLNSTGYEHVHVATRDGALGDSDNGPYDRIIITVGAWDIPPAWWEQLTPGGRLVMPLRWRGQTRAIAFTYEGGTLRSDSVELCGFVPMIGQDGEHSAPIDPASQVGLYWDADQAINPAALHGVLTTPKTETWSQVTLGPGQPFDGVWLRMSATEPGTCRIAASESAIESGLCTPAIGSRSPALVEDDSIAYFVFRRLPDADGERRWELGAIGHGPNGPELADRLCDQIRTWAQARAAQPVITVDRADVDVTDLNAIAKPDSILRITY